jgi:nitrite reductase/ring-hydroxylating ferredoxin subunit
MQPGTALHRIAERTERLSALDGLAGPVARGADRAMRAAGIKSVLSGSWLGHPLHPLATDAVIGSWAMAAILDLRRERRAARTLVGLGVLAALPTAASGVSDWADTPDARVRRMGLVHAASNAAALLLNAASYLTRRAGRDGAGARLTAASALPLTVGGFLGAHMAYARGVGVSRTAFGEQIDDWTPLDLAAPPTEGWTAADVHGLPVLARLGPGEALGVVAAICTHCGARLQPAPDAGETLRCSADGSAFGAADGAVLDGPATTPIPRFEARRAADEGVEVRTAAVA